VIGRPSTVTAPSRLGRFQIRRPPATEAALSTHRCVATPPGRAEPAIRPIPLKTMTSP
jgi:hypothetical protein